MFEITPSTIADTPELVRLIEELQDFIADIDPLARNRRLPKYGETAIENLLLKIKNRWGIIYIARVDGEVAGFIGWFIEPPEKEDLLEIVENVYGIVAELIVSDRFRGKSIGTLLMEKIELFFKENGCSAIMIDVFAPNIGAYEFYKKLGYTDRMHTVTKSL